MVFEMSPAGSIRHATLIDEHGKEEKVGHEDPDSNGGTQTLENMVDIRTIKSRNHSLNSPGVPNHDTQFARKLEFVTKDGSVQKICKTDEGQWLDSFELEADEMIVGVHGQAMDKWINNNVPIVKEFGFVIGKFQIQSQYEIDDTQKYIDNNVKDILGWLAAIQQQDEDTKQPTLFHYMDDVKGCGA